MELFFFFLRIALGWNIVVEFIAKEVVEEDILDKCLWL